MVYDCGQEMSVKQYTVSQLAQMAGVSVRTLHHYHHIGLLQPTTRTEAGYRLYGESELLRLQQILFFKELDLPLQQIGRILDDPEFDPLRALRHHRTMLRQRAERLARLTDAIDKTIHRLTEEATIMTDKKLYEGFTKEQIERYKREAREMYDPALVVESEQRVKKMSPAQWQAVKEEGDEVSRGLAALADRAPGDPEVQALIVRHHAWLEHFWHAGAEQYRALGQGYASHPEFRAFYDKYHPGLADFMAEAMAHYAEETLAENE